MTMSIIQPNALGDGTLTRATTGTYTDAAGVLQTAAINVPRLNYNPADLTLAPQLLVEAAATNLFLFSEQFDNAAWLKAGGVTVTANTSIAPDGNLSMDTATGVAATSAYIRQATAVVPTSTVVAFSIFMAEGTSELTWLRIFNSSVGTEIAGVRIGWTAGVPGFVNFQGVWTTAPKLTKIGGSAVYRFEAAVSSGSFTQLALLFYPSGTAEAKTAKIWGAQAEIGSLATSYIPTTTATVTRAADIVSATGLIYSSAAENDFLEWAAATAYALDAKVIRASTHRIYRRLVAGTTATAPELDAVNWLDIAPTNRHAMFDDKVGTVTSVTGKLTVVMRPGPVAGLALLEIVGRKADAVMKDAPGGVTVYSKTVSLDATLITSVYDWFYKNYEQMTDLVLTDLPSQFVSNELTITISSTTTASVGVCKFGELTNVGQTQYGASVGITDYSRKDVDAFGNVLITKRAFSKRADFSIVTKAADFAALFRKFTAIRATPCVFIGTEAAGFDPFIVYGFYKDFSIVVPYPTNHLCNVSIEGLI